jgi:photosystem II stability/assembly factor-like uncharacterized protein
MIACLSPNGRTTSQGEGPATTLFVATIRGLVVFERADAGAPWTETRRSLEHKHLSCLLYEFGSGRMFAGCHGRGDDGGLFMSDDQGRTWREAMNGLNSGHVYTLAAQERPEGVYLYAGTEPAALYRSKDLGQSWEDLASLREVPGTEKWIFPPPPHIAHVKNVAFHPADPKTLYVCVEQGAVLRTIDDVASWVELDGYASEADSFYHDVHRVALEKADPTRIHLATGDGLYFSPDGGKTWDHQQGRNDRVGYPDALFINPDDDRTIYLGGAGDAPETWRTQGGAHAGFIVSHDGGETWAELMTGIPAPLEGNIEAMAMHHAPQSLAFFAGTAVGDVFTSENGGESWSLLATGLPPISKSRHYRHFLSAEEKLRLEEVGKAERRAEGLADRQYVTNA